jgi:hypothetical protein
MWPPEAGNLSTQLEQGYRSTRWQSRRTSGKFFPYVKPPKIFRKFPIKYKVGFKGIHGIEKSSFKYDWIGRQRKADVKHAVEYFL